MTLATGLRGTAAVLCLGAALTAAKAADAPAPDRGPWLRERIAAASPGELIEIPQGEYLGPFTIDKPLHLRGRGRAVLRGDGRTHVVAIRAPRVTIDGLELGGSGMDLARDHAAIHITGDDAVIRGNRIVDSLHGVYVRKANRVRVEGNTIVGRAETLELVDPSTRLPSPGEGELCAVTLNQNRRGNGLHFWNSTGHVIVNNVISGTRDGVYFSFVDNAEVRGNRISGVRYGLHYMYSDGNRFEDNVFQDNAAGAALMFSKEIVLRHNAFLASRNHRAYGLLLQSVDDTQVIENRIVGNTIGLFVEGSHGNRFLGNRIAGNHVGVHISESSDANAFSRNSFSANLHPVEATAAPGSNAWAIDGVGNLWEGAMRLDFDGNGIADLPHRELDLFGAMRRPFPVIGLLAGSPGERLLRFVHARAGLPGLPGVTDPAPLIRSTPGTAGR
ncbi:MAG TPA: NosD domain-containing protein [Vicinamibacterales bacterium]